MSEKQPRLEWRAGHAFSPLPLWELAQEQLPGSCGPFHAPQGTVTHLVPRQTPYICDTYSDHPPLLEMGKLFQRGRVICQRTHSFGMLRWEQREWPPPLPAQPPQHLADTHLPHPRERPQHGHFFSALMFPAQKRGLT